MKDPAFLFYPNDFSSGTQFFTNEQVGIYLRLLLAQHQHGHLTEKQMRIICGGVIDEEVLAKFVIDSDGKYFNQRLDTEIDKRKKHSEKQKQNANMRWHSQRISNGIDLAMPLENRNRNKNRNKNKDENENKDKNGVETKFDAKDALLKMGVDSNLADEWLKVRKNKRCTNTRTSFLQIWREIKKTELTAQDCIRIAIENSWAGFKADWLTNDTFAKKGHKIDESDLTNPEVYRNIKFN